MSIGNERDIMAKQNESVSDSAAFNDDSIDSEDVMVSPGTGGPDDVGKQKAPGDYDPAGYATPKRV